MKKILSLALALMMLLALGACGSKGGTSDDPNLGKYIGAEFSGDGSQWFLLDEIYDEGESYIELKSGGKGVFCLGGDATDIKWELKSDGSLKLTRDSLESKTVSSRSPISGAARSPSPLSRGTAHPQRKRPTTRCSTGGTVTGMVGGR